MRKLSFLGLCRRRFLSLFSGESPIDQRRICSVTEALYRTQGLSNSYGSVAGFASAFGNRYFHGSGFSVRRNETTMRVLAFLGAQAKMRLRRLFTRFQWIIERVMGLRFVLDFSIYLLILLLLSKPWADCWAKASDRDT